MAKSHELRRNARSRPPRVALLVETSLASGREILQGIARYVREHEPWLLYHQAGGLGQKVPGWLERWKGDGIVARVQTPAMARALARTGLPVVDVLGVVPGARFPLVHVDNRAIGEMAAGHLLERGLRHFAYVGIRRENWSQARQEAFCAAVEKRGHSVVVRNASRRELETETWEAHQTRLARWLSRLARPVGIMVCSDQRASHLLEACLRAGLRVPEDVAVIGVDNDEPLCNVCQPTLTSVLPGHEQTGFLAAALLSRLIRGEQGSGEATLVPPLKIVTRLSTDSIALDDEAVSRALCVIREHAIHRIRIDDIALRVGVSRSVLQRRFRASLGRTINEVLIGQRLKVAQRLLLETKMTLPEVAERSGFEHAEYMASVFRSRLQCTPAGFRRFKSGSGGSALGG
ncbi:MAG: Xylose operon regulatory protein [Verrucomicrobiota bacterium]